MVELSKAWLQKAEDKIANATKGIFFQRTEARLIANFDLNDGVADVDEGKPYVYSIYNIICTIWMLMAHALCIVRM